MSPTGGGGSISAVNFFQNRVYYVLVMILKRAQEIFKVIYFLTIFGFFLFGLGYVYLINQFSPMVTQNSTENIPYYNAVPENATLYFVNGDIKTLVVLDFKAEKVSVDFSPLENTVGNYTVACDNSLLAYFVDAVGGVNITYNGEYIRITGVQSEQLLSSGDTPDIRKRIIAEVIAGISKIGFTKDDLLFITENYEGNLSLKESFTWLDYIPRLCQGFEISEKEH